MRVFYCFNIKDEFKFLYKETPSNLYNILKHIYYLDRDDLLYAKTILNQICNPIDKEEMDKYLFIKLHREYSYSKKKDVHYINNLYKNEISRLIVKKKYIKIESESSFSSFINIISRINNNLFVCDFEYLDFFFIDSIKILV